MLASGEFGYERDTAKAKIGDGATNWVGLPYFQGQVDLTGYVTVIGTPTLGNLAEWLDADTIEDTGIATADLAVQTDLTGMVTVSGVTTLNNVATWVDADTIKDSGILVTDIALNSDLTGMVTVNGTPAIGNVAEWFDADTIEDTGIATADLAVQSDLTGMVTVSGIPVAANLVEWTDANTVEDTGVATSNVPLLDVANTFSKHQKIDTLNYPQWQVQSALEGSYQWGIMGRSASFAIYNSNENVYPFQVANLAPTNTFYLAENGAGMGEAFPSGMMHSRSNSVGKVSFVASNASSATVDIAQFKKNNSTVAGVDKDGNIYAPNFSSNNVALLDASNTFALGQTINANTTTERGLIVNNAASTTVSIAEFRINDTNQVEIDSSGRLVLLSVPTSDPGGTGIVWSDAGTLKIT